MAQILIFSCTFPLTDSKFTPPSPPLSPYPHKETTTPKSAYMIFALWTAVTVGLLLALAKSKANSATLMEASLVMSFILCTTPSTIWKSHANKIHFTCLQTAHSLKGLDIQDLDKSQTFFFFFLKKKGPRYATRPEKCHPNWKVVQLCDYSVELPVAMETVCVTAPPRSMAWDLERMDLLAYNYKWTDFFLLDDAKNL